MQLLVELCFQNPETMAIEKEVFPWTPNMDVQDVLNLSKLFERWPVLKNRPMGVFSQPVSCNSLLQAGDRLEIYAPLKIDPKEARRIRAIKRKS